jgi:hypothetical protein
MNARSSRNLTSVSVSSSGQYLLKVKNTGKSSDFFILEPEVSLPKKEVPSPQSLDKSLSRLHALMPLYRDYAKNEIVQYLVSVEKPGYYLLETTGRLQTSITVRTYVRPSLFTGTTGGSGRNAQVVAYLAKGDYLAEVRTGAQSAGRGGLRLSPVQRREGGTVVAGEIIRTELASGEGYTFTLKVESPGYHRIEAVSLGTSHPVRVEDEGGWLISSGTNPRVEFKAPGLYTIHSLPSAAPHRRRFQVVREPDPVLRADPEKGLVELPLMGAFDAVWNERNPRVPHRYAVHIPADAEVSFSLSKEMFYRMMKDGSLVSEGDGGIKSLSLARGDYLIEVSTREKDNGRPYRIGLSTAWLLPGIPQIFQSQKASFKVSVPEDGIYDIESLSPSDLIAELYDAQGRRVASNDDRRLDWDFSISTTLPKGLYTLSVSSVFGGGGSAQIQITGRMKRDLGVVAVPLSSVYKVKRETLSFSFTPQTTGVYWLLAEHPAIEQVSIERDDISSPRGYLGCSSPL